MQENQLICIDGINIEIGQVQYDKEKMKKVDDYFGEFDILLQGLGDLNTIKNTSGDIFKVYYDKGVGELQKSAKTSGRYRANIVDKNGISGQAELEKLSNGPAIVSGMFNVMSMATGLYYMAEIDSKLKTIDEQVSEIKQYLENDKRSHLDGYIEFLNSIQKNINIINVNEMQRVSTCMTLQNIKIEANSNIFFYKKQIDDLRENGDYSGKINEIVSKIEKLSAYMSGYYYSLYVYSYASSIEPLITRNYNELYYHSLVDDINNKCNEYINNLDKWVESFNDFIKHAKAFGHSKLLAALSISAATSPLPLTKIACAASYYAVDSVDSQIKRNRQDEVLKKLEITDCYYNIEPIISNIRKLELQNDINNRHVEMIVDHGEIYVDIMDLVNRQEQILAEKE